MRTERSDTTADRTEQGRQPVDEELILSEFRKAVSQLGELRRRETQLLRRVALLENEQSQARAALESQSAEAARLRNELADTNRRSAELEDALEAKASELQSMANSASWRFTLPFRSLAIGLAGARQQLKRLFTLFFAG